MTRYRPGAFKNLLLSAATVACLLVATELVLRVVYHPASLGTIIRFDRNLGWTLQPNSSLHSVEPNYGLDYKVRINSKGMREREFDVAKSPGTTRILALGDSFVFGSGVENDQRFTDFLQRSFDGNVEVINTGVPGWGNDQELLYFESVADKLQPDIVLLVFMTANDVVNNMIDHLFMRTAPKPKFVLDNGELRLTNSPIELPPQSFKTRLRQVARKSRLLLFVKRRLLRLHVEPNPTPVAPKGTHVPEWLSRHPNAELNHWSVYQTPLSPAMEDGYAVTEAIFERLKKRCDDIGAKLLVFSFPLRVELDDDWRETLMTGRGIDPAHIDLTQPYRRIDAVCERMGVPFIYPYEEFNRVYDHTYLYFERDEHPNMHAHALAARILLDEFERRYAITHHIAGVDRGVFDTLH